MLCVGLLNNLNILVTHYLFMQICNAVAVASLLNATLVLPRFLYSNVWKDPRSAISSDFNCQTFTLVSF